jgi:hypothetical protein
MRKTQRNSYGGTVVVFSFVAPCVAGGAVTQSERISAEGPCKTLLAIVI